ncbi:DUF2845 domain-containing protein [Stutzerimonas decontaminans]|jgi:hypothetical protein|uniref:DUF2845 domain-containing protein n=2 Tax=Stutzerimonas TaxID=2901164 RepID=A0ABX4VT16_9GAMM|nr:DUF2845 domain-containing protein [Stutzerimonas decontaminans]AHY44086.1 hypothetical protein UIB01_17035 [Stutzerimonas decontaminans]MCQ4243858.1 DUF2845 domain-containing protein [Stutzerimonas decontaminans]MCW8158876.1 DUF2845 domain-containing protein [Stutzerimonas stutzeri]PNF83311.1 DUF2845 domain-containing protein [Stutzerimonas decontaminans]
MTATRYLVGGLLLVAFTSAQADTMRCGSQLVTTGDRAFEVERKCGMPQHRDLVGYTLSRNDRQEFALEEWVYGPRNGMLSILTFEGNRLVRIETRRAN